MSRTVTFALAGNPNSGKTTTFNAMTGARQHVGNYPGITVETKEGAMKADGMNIRLVDLPGTYSLTAYTAEELAARNFIVNERPDIVLDVIDANTLERSLYLTVQFLEMGVPVVLALNMMDEVRKRNITLDSRKLSELLNVPVVETVARTGTGKDSLMREALGVVRESSGEWKPLEISYGPDIDEPLKEMVRLIEAENFLTDKVPPRWLALKIIEGDEEVLVMARRAGKLSVELERIAADVEKHLRAHDTYPEAAISDYRYGYIASLIKQGVLKKDDTAERIAFSDKADRVLTHAFLGPVIMLGVLYMLFQVTFMIGEVPMGWLEMFFGWLGGTAEAILPDGPLQSLIVSGVIDGVGGVLGFVPLIVVMFLMITFLEDLGYMARIAYMLDRVFKGFGLHGSSVMPFIVSGGIPGGCAVPGVMAARTLRSPKERLATILTSPFMACGAKVPVFILLIAAFFRADGGDALFVITLVSWAFALIVGKLLRVTVIKGPATPFLMELPPYRIPALQGVLLHTWERAWQYIKKAGTVILAISVLLWAAMTYPGLPEDTVQQFDQERAALSAQMESVPESARAALEEQLGDVDFRQAEEALRNSAAGRLGTSLEGVTKAAGFDWRTNIALIGGIAAKEVIVSTLGTAYSLGEVDPEESVSLSARLKADPFFSARSALALIAFVILYAPCFVTVVTIAREASWKWAAFSVGFNTVFGFLVAVAVYQVSGLWL